MNLTIIGKYKIIKELGAGGFGAVYLAQDPKLGTQVAIKVFQVKDENLAGLATSSSQDASGILQERFLSEARTLEGLSHNPYVVNLKEFDEMPGGTPYYVMPYLPNSLENEIGKDAFTRGKLEDTPKELHPRKLASARALEILKQILEGMSAVHKAGLIHRDIKPANILFDTQGNVQICDFGIAKLPDAEHSQSGVGMGSRNYMSPEQRESAKHVSPASDVYSIGVLAYRMLTGQLPSHPYEPPIQFSPGIGQAVNDLIDIAIAQQEAKRPADAGAFLKQLNKAITSVDAGAEGEDGEETGTWVEEGKADIRPELKPLKDKIEALLLSEGEIPEAERFGLEALATVGNLESNELDVFIGQLKEHNKAKIQPLNKWLGLVKDRAKAEQGQLSPSTRQALLSAGLAIGMSEEKTEAKLNSITTPYLSTSPASDKAGEPRQNTQSQKSQRQKSQSSVSKTSQSQTSQSHSSDSSAGGTKWLWVLMILVSVIGGGGYVVWQAQEAPQSVKSEPRTYQLTVHSTPSNASINIDGKNIDGKSVTSGNSVSLTPGTYSLTASASGYETVTKTIDVRMNQTERIRLVRSAPVTYPLTIETRPTDAQVQVLNISPVYYAGMPLAAGEYQIRVSKTGYGSDTRWITLNSTQQRFSIDLTPTAPTYPQGVQALLDSMVTIPGGSFQMGSNEGDSDEKPVHRVSIKPFRLMETEVTWAMYQPCIDAGVCPDNTSGGGDNGWGKGNRPVIEVSWNNITQEYIPWLNKQTGQSFRLPTEAQWEYAARSGSTTKYSWGDDIGRNKANCDGCGSQWDDSKTAPVKSFAPNAFGLYDMHGNVWEWVQDCYNDSYNGAPGNGSAWMQGDCGRAVLRGGSWGDIPLYLRSATRLRGNRKGHGSVDGFRLAQGE